MEFGIGCEPNGNHASVPWCVARYDEGTLGPHCEYFIRCGNNGQSGTGELCRIQGGHGRHVQIIGL